MFLGPNVPHAYLSGDCVEVWDTSCQNQVLIENEKFWIEAIINFMLEEIQTNHRWKNNQLVKPLISGDGQQWQCCKSRTHPKVDWHTHTDTNAGLQMHTSWSETFQTKPSFWNLSWVWSSCSWLFSGQVNVHNNESDYFILFCFWLHNVASNISPFNPVTSTSTALSLCLCSRLGCCTDSRGVDRIGVRLMI